MQTESEVDDDLPKCAHRDFYWRQATDHFGDCWKQATEIIIEDRGYVPADHGQPGISSRRRDVFAFGVLLLELLTGRKPFDGYVFHPPCGVPSVLSILLPIGLNDGPFFSFNTVPGQGRSNIWWNGLPPGSMMPRVWIRW